MPGRNRLASELAVNGKTVEAALRQLEREGLLVAQGPGRKRRIVTPGNASVVRPLRVAILFNTESDRELPSYIVELQHELVEAGHTVIRPARTLAELKFDLKRIARLVGQTAADAWVVSAGSREVLKWFSEQPVPVIALFGHRTGLPIAAVGPDKRPAMAAATRQLIQLGHRRIVLLCGKIRRVPEPGGPERSFLDELAAHGIATGAFNLPDWNETIHGFQERLDSLFRVTPPTALIIDESPFFIAAQQFLARRGFQVPEKVSLICTDSDSVFAWCEPTIAHIHWDSRPVLRRIILWAAAVGRGKRDVRQTLTPASFIPGGTIGPAPTN